jgi:hypothetical protein
MIRPRSATLVLALALPLLGGCPEGVRQEQWTPEMDAARAGARPPAASPAAAPTVVRSAKPSNGDRPPALSEGATDLGTAPPLGRIGDPSELPRNQPATMRLVVTKVTGSLPKEVIERTLRRNQARLRLCQERAGAKDPYIQAIASFSFTIDADGRVKAGETQVKDLGEASEAEACLKDALGASVFAGAEGGAVKVQLTMSLSPGEADGTIDGKPLRDVKAADVAKALTDAGFADVVMTPKGARGMQLISAKKGADAVSLVFVPYDAEHPVTEGPEWDAVQESTVVHGFDGARFFLGAKAKDRAATKALLLAIIKPAG